MRKLFLLLSVLYSTVALCNIDVKDRFSIKDWLFGESDARQKEEDKELELLLCGKSCPTFALTDVSGKLWSDQNIKGKVTVIVIWHVYCEACIKEIPKMNDVVKQYPEVNFLAMTFNTEQQVKKVLTTKPCKVTQLTNALGFISQIGVVATPTKLVLDKKGVVRYIIRGGGDKQHKHVLKRIKELSKE